jgi:2-phospho-L-lactate/phosphoenolpyruvate guanylyltransferase
VNYAEQRTDFRLMVLLPVKTLSAAKSRLHPLLSPSVRYNLALQMFRCTLQILREIAVETVVISPDPLILAEAFGNGVNCLNETNLPMKLSRSEAEHLNNLLPAAISQISASQSYDWLLVLPSDLPLLTTSDLGTVQNNLSDVQAVIVPDRKRRGTNLLALRSKFASDFQFQFGLDSFEKHCHMFEEMELNYKILEPPGITFDLDTGADWEQLIVLNPDFSSKTSGYTQSYPHSQSKCG